MSLVFLLIVLIKTKSVTDNSNVPSLKVSSKGVGRKIFREEIMEKTRSKKSNKPLVTLSVAELRGT